MKSFKLTSSGMVPNEKGVWYHHAEVADLQRQLADANDDKKTLHEGLRNAYGKLADAIRERDQYKAACELADALRPLGVVQVVEGGAAVLLDTSKGAM